MSNISPVLVTGLTTLVSAVVIMSGPSEIATQARKFTVQIDGETMGSGTIIHREEKALTDSDLMGSGKNVAHNSQTYTVLTAWHVVKHPGEYSIITSDNQKHDIRKIQHLPDVDLALIEFTAKPDDKIYQTAELGDSKNLTSGESIYIAGYPNPYSNKPQRNYLLQTAQALSIKSLTEEGYRIVHDRHLIPGTSGGAILDDQARIIGINGILTKEGNSDRTFGIGIPIQVYKAGKDQFINVTSYQKLKTNQTLESGEVSSSLEENLTTRYVATESTPAGHFGDVNSVAVRGNIVVTGSEDKTIKIWNLQTNKIERTLVGHSASISAVIIAGNKIISGSQDSTIKVWNLTTGELERTLTGHSSGVNALAISEDGNTLVSGSGDRTVKVWDLIGGYLKQTLIEDTSDKSQKDTTTGPVYGVAIHDNIVVSGSQDKKVRIWDLNTKKPPIILIDKKASDPPKPVGNLLNPGKAPKKSKKKKIPVSHSASVDTVATDGKIIASGSSDNTIKIWDLTTGKLKRTLKGSTTSVGQIAIAGSTLVSASSNYETVQIWNFKTGALRRTLSSDNYFWFSRVALSPEEETFILANQNGSIQVRDLHNGKLKKTLTSNSDSIRTVVISGDKIISASQGNAIAVRNINTGQLQSFLEGHTGEVNCLAVQDNILVSGSQDRTIRVWNLTTGKLERTIHNYLDPNTRSLAISEDGKTLISGSYQTIKFWDLTTGKLFRFIDAHHDGVNTIAISGDTIVSGGGDKIIEVRSFATGELKHTLTGHTASINSVVVSNNQIFSASYDKTIKIWNLDTGKLEGTLTGHSAGVNSLALENNTLVSGSTDGTIEAWNINTRQLEAIIPGHSASVNTVAINGNTIVSGSYDNTIKIWQKTEVK